MKNSFTYKYWDSFCKELSEKGYVSVSARDMTLSDKLVLKHDVESMPKKALEIAKIEAKYGHKGSYYFQYSLLSNLDILKEIQRLGHEVSYHYDTLDNNNGNFELAKQEFKEKINDFRREGFECRTVCQHGNPLVDRVGYNSNRDLFRKTNISNELEVLDIMAGYQNSKNMEITYFSDAGYKLKRIEEHENSDVLNKNSVVKDSTFYENYDHLIISIHPHRYMSSTVLFSFKRVLFNSIRFGVRTLSHVPVLKKILSRFNAFSKRL